MKLIENRFTLHLDENLKWSLRSWTALKLEKCLCVLCLNCGWQVNTRSTERRHPRPVLSLSLTVSLYSWRICWSRWGWFEEAIWNVSVQHSLVLPASRRKFTKLPKLFQKFSKFREAKKQRNFTPPNEHEFIEREREGEKLKCKCLYTTLVSYSNFTGFTLK